MFLHGIGFIIYPIGVSVKTVMQRLLMQPNNIKKNGCII